MFYIPIWMSECNAALELNETCVWIVLKILYFQIGYHTLYENSEKKYSLFFGYKYVVMCVSVGYIQH